MKNSVKIGLALSLVAVVGVGGAVMANDAREDAQYQDLATVTLEQAIQIAETAYGGNATEIELDEEDGSLVYEVEFVDADVLVDAGSGEVLRTELDNDPTEAPIQGSIQVPAD